MPVQQNLAIHCKKSLDDLTSNHPFPLAWPKSFRVHLHFAIHKLLLFFPAINLPRGLNLLNSNISINYAKYQSSRRPMNYNHSSRDHSVCGLVPRSTLGLEESPFANISSSYSEPHPTYLSAPLFFDLLNYKNRSK